MKRRSLLLAAPLGWSLANIALAQSAYPSKTIRYIVPVSAGGGSDMVGRTVCVNAWVACSAKPSWSTTSEVAVA